MEIIGGIDKIDLPDFNLENVLAKIDTGANRSAIHCTDIRRLNENGIEYLEFNIPIADSNEPNIIRTESFFQKKIKSSTAHVEMRYVVHTSVVIFGRRIKASFSLTDRSKMKFPILLGRKLLNKRFLVDVSQRNLSFAYKQRIKNKNLNH